MPGPGVDALGNPVIDPTANVLALVEAANKRQDDLRAASEKSADQLREASTAHVKELMELRAQHAEQMRLAESARIDSVRAIDVGAVTRAAEVQAAQASTLAAQVATSAETLRGQVQAAAQASTIALAAALEPIQKSIDDLRRVQYEQQGQRAAQTETRTSVSQNVGIVISLVFLGLAIAGFAVSLVVR